MKMYFWQTHLRADSLMFGVLISYFYHFHSEHFRDIASRYKYPLIVLGIIFLSPVFFLQNESMRFIHTFGFTLFYVGGGLLLSGFLYLQLSDPISKVASYIGYHSYSIYLWHALVLSLSQRIPNRINSLPGYIPLNLRYFGFYIFLSISLGIIMAKLIEIPALQIREKFFPSRGQAYRCHLITRSHDSRIEHLVSNFCRLTCFSLVKEWNGLNQKKSFKYLGHEVYAVFQIEGFRNPFPSRLPEFQSEFIVVHQSRNRLSQIMIVGRQNDRPSIPSRITSGKAVILVATQGISIAIASNSATPSPSAKLGKTNTSAAS